MYLLRILTIVLCSAVCGVGCSTEDDSSGSGGVSGQDRVLDFSEFEAFALSQGSAVGFCPFYDRVFSAEVHKMSEIEYEFEYVAFNCVAAVDSCDSCPPSTGCGEVLDDEIEEPLCCWEQAAPSSRALEGEEIARLKGLFSVVQELAEPAVFDIPCYSWDPCVLIILSWDSYTDDDNLCGSPRIAQETSIAILAALSEIAGVPP